MAAMMRDLRNALRSLARRPALSMAVILTLGLGLGATTAVFSLVNGVVLRPLPYPESDRLVELAFSLPNFPKARQSEATFLHIRDRNETLDAFALARAVTVTYQRDGGTPVRLQAATVTPELFRVLGISPALGSALGPEDNLPGALPVVILTHGFWQSSFGGSMDVLGRSIRIDGVARRIVGVLPPRVRFPTEETQVWVPHVIDPANPVPATFFYNGYGRLKADATLEGLVQDGHRLIRALPDAYPGFFGAQRGIIDQIDPRITSLRSEVVGDAGTTLWILLGAMGGVLLIAVANVANLFLVRAESRDRELAVRRVLGAGRARVVQHLLVEALLLSLAGGTLGLLLARAGLSALVSLGPATLPRLSEVGLGGPVLAFGGLASVVTGLMLGVVPALRIRRGSLADPLRSGAGGAGVPRGRQRFRSAMVVVQVALALALLVGSGLLLRTFASLKAVDPGFDPGGVLGLRIALPNDAYPDHTGVYGFWTGVLDEVRQLPGVESAAVVEFLPLRDGRVFLNWDVEDRPLEPDQIPASVLSKVVSDDYFRTLGIPIVAGRAIGRTDARSEGDPVVVVSEAYARRYWDEPAAAVGRRIRAGRDVERWARIVGVSGDVRDRSLSEPGAEMVYVPMLPDSVLGTGLRWREASLAVRGHRPRALIPAIRALVQGRDPDLPAYDIRTMDRVVTDATARTRFILTLLATAAIGALFLAGIGLYGVMAYVVGRRRKEIGLRMALGAPGLRVRREVVRRAMTLAFIGVVLGSLAALGTSRFLASTLYGVSPADPATFAGVSAVLLGVAWLASSLPARRAASIDPARSLRED